MSEYCSYEITLTVNERGMYWIVRKVPGDQNTSIVWARDVHDDEAIPGSEDWVIWPQDARDAYERLAGEPWREEDHVA